MKRLKNAGVDLCAKLYTPKYSHNIHWWLIFIYICHRHGPCRWVKMVYDMYNSSTFIHTYIYMYIFTPFDNSLKNAYTLVIEHELQQYCTCTYHEPSKLSVVGCFSWNGFEMGRVHPKIDVELSSKFVKLP